MFDNYFKNKKILITGHNGFKGSWLTLWINSLGGKIVGVSKKDINLHSHFKSLKINNNIKEYFVDITNFKKIYTIIKKEKPEIIFHLAAQAIVSKSFTDPLETYSTNSFGTLNILDSLRTLNNKCNAVFITSDKTYKNNEWVWGYRENDTLGGEDPYSSSKSIADILIDSYYKNYFKNTKNIKVAATRAGNVIGGGDWSKNRIVPDIINAIINNKSLNIRNPNSTRPWQFVLEPLGGYLKTAYMLDKNKKLNGEAFNFGPKPSNNYSVKDLANKLIIKWPLNNKCKLHFSKSNMKESSLLKLNCEKSEKFLNWKSVLEFDDVINFTSKWYFNYYKKQKNIKEMSLEQIKIYEKLAYEKKIFSK